MNLTEEWVIDECGGDSGGTDPLSDDSPTGTNSRYSERFEFIK